MKQRPQHASDLCRVVVGKCKKDSYACREGSFLSPEILKLFKLPRELFWEGGTNFQIISSRQEGSSGLGSYKESHLLPSLGSFNQY